MGKHWENAGEYEPPDGWRFSLIRRAAHECGWVCTVPWDDPAGYQAEVWSHGQECPWPDMPEVVETVSD